MKILTILGASPQFIKAGFSVVGSKVLVKCLTFKESGPDSHDLKVLDIIGQLTDYNTAITIWYPWVNPQEAENKWSYANK